MIRESIVIGQHHKPLREIGYKWSEGSNTYGVKERIKEFSGRLIVGNREATVEMGIRFSFTELVVRTWESTLATRVL